MARTSSAAKTASEEAAAETEAKKAPAKKPASKKETETKKASAKKAPAKKEAEISEEPAKETSAQTAEIKATVNFEFNGKSYTPEDLLKSCRDVWQYDLNGKEEDLKSIELYVKPEDNATYYVINGDVTGSFPV